MSDQITITLRIVYAICLLITGTIALIAQDQAEIALNRPQQIALTGSGWQTLTYHAAGPQWVDIRARSLEAPGELDLTLEVLGTDGRRLPAGFADDVGEGDATLTPTDARLPALFLPAEGEYVIRVSSFNGVSAGKAEVVVVTAERFQAQATPHENQIRIEAHLPAGERYHYRYEGQPGQRITVIVRDLSGTLDPLLAVYDIGGARIAFNDDHSEQFPTLDVFDAAIEDLALPSSGSITLEVGDVLGSAGRFELRIILSEQPAASGEARD